MISTNHEYFTVFIGYFIITFKPDSRINLMHRRRCRHIYHRGGITTSLAATMSLQFYHRGLSAASPFDNAG
jgi:hypothetical protein